MKTKRQLTKVWIVFVLSAVIWMGMSVSTLAADGILSMTCNQNEITAMESLEVRIDAGMSFNSADIVLMYDSDSLTFDRENTDLRDIALVQEVESGKIRLIDYGEERTGYTLKFLANETITEEVTATLRVKEASFGSAASATTEDIAVAACKNAVLEVTVKPKTYQVTFEKIEGFMGTFPDDEVLSGKEDYTFTVPSIVHYTVIPVVSINGGDEMKPEVKNNQVTVPKEAVIGNIEVRFELKERNECAGNSDNGYVPVHQFASDIVYTWYGFRACEASRTCGCGEIRETMTASISAEVVEDEGGTKRRYTAVFGVEEALFETDPQFKYGAPMTVSFRLVGDYWHGSESLTEPVGPHTDYVTWIPTAKYEVYEGMTAADVLDMALEEFQMQVKGSGNYIAGIKAPDVLGGYWLEEFSNGDNSGWLYAVNGTSPGVGLSQYELVLPQDQPDTVGDGVDEAILMYYVDDYTKEDAEREAARKAEDISPDEFLWKSCAFEKVSDGNYVLKMAAVPKNAHAIAAGYTTEGQMIGSVVLDLKDMTKTAAGMRQMEVAMDGDLVKIFFLNTTTQKPMRTCIPFMQ